MQRAWNAPGRRASTRRSWSRRPAGREEGGSVVEKKGPVERTEELERGGARTSAALPKPRDSWLARGYLRVSWEQLSPCLATSLEEERGGAEEEKRETRGERRRECSSLRREVSRVLAISEQQVETGGTRAQRRRTREERIRAYLRIGVELGGAGFRVPCA